MFYSVASFSKYLVAFSLMEMNFSPQVPHLRLVRYERTLILLFWTRLVIGRKTLGGPSGVRYTVIKSVASKLSLFIDDPLSKWSSWVAQLATISFFYRWRALPETFVRFLMFIDTFKSFSLTFYWPIATLINTGMDWVTVYRAWFWVLNEIHWNIEKTIQTLSE